MMRWAAKPIVAALALLASNAASGVVFEGTAIGSWSNPDATFGFTIDNSDVGGVATFDWGTPTAGSFSNRFTFDGVGSDGGTWSAPDETAFRIGDFAYRNGAVSGHDVEGVDLSIALSIISPTGVSDFFVFQFDIENTPNTTGDPVLDGDIVSIINAFSPTVFSFSGVSYTLELLGFSTDDGNTITSQFSSPENSIASAGVFARITTDIPSVPAPPTLVVLGPGLLGVSLLGRRRRARRRRDPSGSSSGRGQGSR